MNKRFIILGLFLGVIELLFVVKPVTSPTIKKPQWQIYQNSKYGFQFSYPLSWQKEEWDLKTAAGFNYLTDGTILYQGKFFGQNDPPIGGFEILIWQNKSKTPVRTWLTWYRHEDLNLAGLPPKENFTVLGFPAIRYLQKTTARKKPLLYIFFARDDKIYELTEERLDLIKIEATASSQLAEPVYDKILESFRFMVK